MGFNEKMKTHESYGMIGVHRQTGRSRLFGSALEGHDTSISITIREAKVGHDLSQNWFYGDKIIAEVHMSQAQYAEMITTPNVGNGVPCTIRYRHTEGFKEMEALPDEPPEHARVKAEFVAEMDALLMKLKPRKAKVEAILAKKNINKADREELRAHFSSLSRFLWDHAPFVVDQFSRATERVVTTAKGEIDSFLTAVINRTGLEQLRKLQAAIPPPDEEPLRLTAREDDD